MQIAYEPPGIQKLRRGGPPALWSHGARKDSFMLKGIGAIDRFQATNKQYYIYIQYDSVSLGKFKERSNTKSKKHLSKVSKKYQTTLTNLTALQLKSSWSLWALRCLGMKIQGDKATHLPLVIDPPCQNRWSYCGKKIPDVSGINGVFDSLDWFCWENQKTGNHGKITIKPFNVGISGQKLSHKAIQ